MTIRTVLCFGDSNTWGATPDDSGRFDWHTRWPGVLQRLLGTTWHVQEDGHCGRTTVFDDPCASGKRGIDDLPKAIERAEPLDQLIIMLGTNDVKTRINIPAPAIAEGMGKLVEVAQASNVVKKILIISPPAIVSCTANLRTLQFDGSIEKLAEVAKHYCFIAQHYNVDFLNLTELLSCSPIDGIHLTRDTHDRIAHCVYDTISKIH